MSSYLQKESVGLGAKVTSLMIPALLATLLITMAGCGSGDPFSYIKVTGKITYDDDTPIPTTMILYFHPQTAAINAKTHPRFGSAAVDGTAGTFDTVTSHTYGDGLVRGKHKVTILATDLRPLPAKIIPREYFDPDETPLEVDTAEQPFVLKVKKPKASR